MRKIISVVFALAVLASVPFIYSKFVTSSHVPDITIDKTDGYQLLVDGKPYLIKGACYNPIPIGKDYEYNFWGDPDKPWLVDGEEMRAMGVNTVRFYHAGKNPDQVKQVLNDLHGKFGIRVLMGTYLGFWNWPPPNYSDEAFREKVRTEVLEMVRLYKDSPAVLMWVLGNENNYSFDQNVQRWSNDAIDALPDAESQRKEKARIYYTFVNRLARDIKKIDPKHPVAMGVGEVASLDLAKPVCPDIDILGMIAYRGPTFGNLFRQVKQKFDLPMVMIEWGADSYNAYRREPDEESQAEFLKLQWQDIERNAAGKKGVGNSLGGTFFEWTDEWWKGNENLPYTWTVQETAAHWYNASYHYDAQAAERLNMNEEWWGVVALDPKNKFKGMDKRVPKKSYFVLKNLWTKKQLKT